MTRHSGGRAHPAAGRPEGAAVDAFTDGVLPMLDDALAVLGDPLRDVLGALSGDDFVDLAWHIPNPDRTRFLKDLKVPPARRPPPAAGRIALERLRRFDDGLLRRALRLLTVEVTKILDDVVHHHPATGDTAGALDRAVARFGAPVVLAHLLGEYENCPGHARLLPAALR